MKITWNRGTDALGHQSITVDGEMVEAPDHLNTSERQAWLEGYVSGIWDGKDYKSAS